MYRRRGGGGRYKTKRGIIQCDEGQFSILYRRGGGYFSSGTSRSVSVLPKSYLTLFLVHLKYGFGQYGVGQHSTKNSTTKYLIFRSYLVKFAY